MSPITPLTTCQALGSLRADNVLEYFSQSPFFDRRSNNAVLKMQSQFQNFGDVKEALKKMRGIEFVVSHQSPPDLFVINKQQRESYNQGATDQCHVRVWF